ncbi:SIR2 family protein [Flavobacterium sp. DGU11]|uniref:SIR2 family protein n=1 Tax=Flavobacterium arundinis TaxID=3139143 RepID=A0ABU9HUP0_9FLAO
MNFESDFELHLKKFNTSPYFFIGSGFSSRYINNEGWADLLSNVTNELKLKSSFHYYKSKSANDLTAVATLMATDLFEDWWKEERFEDSRKEFEKSVQDTESPLKFEICKYLSKNEMTINPELISEYRLLKKVNIEGIITTNWDLLLEKTFPEFNVFVGQDKLIFNNSIDVGETYKIHGCVTHPDSLVVTSKDYEEFHQKNPYLAAKLLTIFMEHPIIFLGYNIGDKNIHSILASIIKILDRKTIDKLKDRLIFCERDLSVTECIMSDGNYLINELNLPIKRIKYSSLDEVYKVLANNNRKLPIKILRHMKHMVYDFVKNSRSKSKVYLADDSNINDLDMEKVQFVYGFGIKENLSILGIKGITSRDLLLDVINDNLNVNPSALLSAIPNLQGKYFPYFKYLRSANLLDEKGDIPANDETKELSPAFIEKANNIRIEDFYPATQYHSKKEYINSKYNSVNELIAGESDDHVPLFIPFLDLDKIDPKNLLDYIKGKDLKIEDLKTHVRKLICLYDFIKYKQQK